MMSILLPTFKIQNLHCHFLFRKNAWIATSELKFNFSYGDERIFILNQENFVSIPGTCYHHASYFHIKSWNIDFFHPFILIILKNRNFIESREFFREILHFFLYSSIQVREIYSYWKKKSLENVFKYRVSSERNTSRW